MTAEELVEYAEKQIESLGLGHGGALGTEFVCAYPEGGKVRISDGHGQEICDSKESVDAALQAWVDWLGEEQL